MPGLGVGYDPNRRRGYAGSPSSAPAPAAAPAAAPALPPAPTVSSAPTPMPDFTSSAQTDPNLQAYLSRVTSRLDNPGESTGRAIDIATGKIRDAHEGRRAALKGLMSQRGVLNSSSIPELTEANLMESEAGDVSSAATSIALGREHDMDALLLGSAGAFQAPGAASRADRAFGLEAWQAAEAARQARERQQTQQYMDMIGIIANLGRI